MKLTIRYGYRMLYAKGCSYEDVEYSGDESLGEILRRIEENPQRNSLGQRPVKVLIYDENGCICKEELK